MEFTSRVIVYVAFMGFAFVFYMNVRDMPVEARTMPMMAIVAVIGIAGALLASEIGRQVWARGASSRSASTHAATGDEPAPETEPGEDDSAVSDPGRVEGQEPGIPVRRVLTYALPASVLVGAYVVLLPRLGFLFASMGFMAAMTVLLGARSVVRVALFALLLPAILQVVFEQLLQLNLP